MKIMDFTREHVERAVDIARANYEAQRLFVPALPSLTDVAFPDFSPFAENGLGVAAFDGERMLGYLCCVGPFPGAFRATDAVGVFSPMHGNGTLPEDRARIYARLYQAAAEKWVKNGATSHAVCLYAHDVAAQEQFFWYGFGLRCVDAIRPIHPFSAPEVEGVRHAELPESEFHRIRPLNELLVDHLEKSPAFMRYPALSQAEWNRQIARPGIRYFASYEGERMVAYVKLGTEGETFVCEAPGMLNISGAYCAREYQGTGVFRGLLGHVVKVLGAQGYTRLGVDFESFNPPARGFWLKHFDAYTHSVVRRIDERILSPRA